MPQGRAPADAGAPLPPHKIRRTRTGGVWVAMACFAVVLLLLLIFIVQNDRTVGISYLGAHGHIPLGVALLLAAVFGVILVVLPGTARIIQLRIAAHHRYRPGVGPVRLARQRDRPRQRDRRWFG